jgi:hypothetical protein
LRISKPTAGAAVKVMTDAFRQHYNYERPHQGLACGNQPPCVAFPSLPVRPALPALIDPDRWVEQYAGHCCVRKVHHATWVRVDDVPSFLTKEVVGKQVTLRVAAATQEFVVAHAGQEVKRMLIKGLGNDLLSFEAYLTQVCAEARTDRQPYRPCGSQLSLPL